MDDCKGVRHEFDSQGTSQRVAYDFGCALLGFLGWAQAALVIACVALAFGAQAPKAYALSARNAPEMVIDGNMVGDDAGSKGYLCVNCSQYTATLELIGHYADLPQIDQEKYSLLVGGNNPFSSLMKKWKELKGGEGDEPTNTWMGADDFLDGWLILAGKCNCWYGTFTDQQIQNAEIAFNSIMQGGSGGSGGGGVVPDGDVLEVAAKVYQNFAWKGYSFNDGDTITLRLPSDDNLTYFLSFMDNYTFTVGFAPTGADFNTSIANITFWCYAPKLEFAKYVNPTDNNVGWQTEQAFNEQLYYGSSYTTTSSWYFDSSTDTIVVGSIDSSWFNRWNNGKTNTWKALRKQELLLTTSKWGAYWPSNIASACNIPIVGFDINNVEVPDVPLPPDDDPEPPSPTPPTPDPPEPKDPTPRDPIPKPDPPRVYPKIDLPDVHITTEPTNTQPTDYTPWLRAIYQELKAFHEDFGTYFQDLLDELENHCQHIRDEISTQASYLGDCVEDVANEVTQQGNNLSNTIWEYAEWLSKYMDAFGEWLVEHLSWNNEVNVDPYDDTSLMYWIRRIYTKLGGSNQPVNSRPTDPVLNPKDTGNWLNELWETILKELAQLFPNLMIDLGLIFDDLKSKFPFSIPWDIHALLLLLVTEPVAPHFTVPMYAFTTSYELEQIGEYDIDLSFYTDYLMGVHLMLEIAWIGYMLKHTKDYMELIEAVIPS